MKRLTALFLAVCVLAALGTLTGCKKDERFQTAFPLEQEVVTATLEKVGLPGVISESETASYTDGHISYIVRSPAQTYEGTENSVFLAEISSANEEGERVLYTTFDQPVASNEVVWEDWKPQIVLATLLYGGFEQEEDVYQAFLEKEFPEGKTSFGWDAQLPAGYCKVAFSFRSHLTYDEEGVQTRERSATLRVNIYESEALYNAIQSKQAEQSRAKAGNSPLEEENLAATP